MRYSITGTTLQQVEQVGGIAIKEAPSIKIIFAELTEAQVTALKAQGYTVTEVGKITVGTSPPVPIAARPIYATSQLAKAAGIDKLRAISSPPLYGSGINIAVIGTGIREAHQFVLGRVQYSKSFTSSPSVEDEFDHDTAVAGIITEIAPLCNLLNLRVIDSTGNGTEEDCALAIDMCCQMHDDGEQLAPHIINLSLGSPDTGEPNNPMRVACRAATDRGIWIFAAAGNLGPAVGTITSPACERYVFAVGSCGYEPFVVSSFSSRGPTKEGLTKPDGVSFGEDLIVASSASDIATTGKSGTSFSTPFGSGTGALVIEGILRRAKLTFEVSGLSYEEVYAATWKDVIDRLMPLVSIQPGDEPREKNNDSGAGMPFGPYMLQSFQVAGAISGINVSSMLGMVMAMGMMGMMMKATGVAR